MAEIMPKGVKGTHAFCAAQQSHGAASLTKIVKGEGKEKEDRSDDEQLQVDIPFPSTSASTLTSALIPVSLSASTSASAPVSSKHRYSALDDGESILSTSHNSNNSSSKKQKHHGGAMIEGVKASLDIIGTSMCDLAAECKLHRLQEDAQAKAQVAAQAYAMSSSPQCRHEAMQHLQQTETYLDADRMVALINLVLSDMIAATAYLSLEWEDYYKVWVVKQLKELGYIEGLAVDM